MAVQILRGHETVDFLVCRYIKAAAAGDATEIPTKWNDEQVQVLQFVLNLMIRYMGRISLCMVMYALQKALRHIFFMPLSIISD